MTAGPGKEHEREAASLALVEPLCDAFFEEFPNLQRLSTAPLLGQQEGSKPIAQMNPSELLVHWQSIQDRLSARLDLLWRDFAAMMPEDLRPDAHSTEPAVRVDLNDKYQCIQKFDQWSRAWKEMRVNFDAAEANLEPQREEDLPENTKTLQRSTKNRTLAEDGIDELSMQFTEMFASTTEPLTRSWRTTLQSIRDMWTGLVGDRATELEDSSERGSAER